MQAEAAPPRDMEPTGGCQGRGGVELAPGTVDAFIEEAGCLAEIGDDEARVVPRRTARGPNDFGFDDDWALAVPRAGGIAGGGVDMRRTDACWSCSPARHRLPSSSQTTRGAK